MNDTVLKFIDQFINAKTIEPIESINEEKLDEIKNILENKLFPIIDEIHNYENKKKIYNKLIDHFYQWQSTQKKPWLKDKTVIAIMGKYSTGKSSIINSILGQKVLPVDLTPTTAIPTYISFRPVKFVQKIFGTSAFVKVIDNLDIIREVDIKTFKSITKDSFKDVPLTSLVKYFVLEFDNINLKEYSLLDTPGYNSIDDRDRQKVIEVLRECDYILWVVDIEDGEISNDALDFIKKNINDRLISFIINKADLKPPSERERVLNKIKNTIKNNGIRFVDCFLYSTKDNSYLKRLYDNIKSLTIEKNYSFFNEATNCINELNDELSKRLIEKKRERSKYESDINSIQNSIKKSFSKFVSDLDYKISKIMGLVDEGIIWDTIDKKKLNQSLSGLRRFITEKSILSDELMELGKLQDKLHETNEIIKKYEEYKSRLIEIKHNFKNLIEEVL